MLSDRGMENNKLCARIYARLYGMSTPLSGVAARGTGASAELHALIIPWFFYEYTRHRHS